MNNILLMPYQNLSLEDLPGEEWKAIAGYEGSYQVSNMGRVKSLKRWRGSGLGINGGYFQKEKIKN